MPYKEMSHSLGNVVSGMHANTDRSQTPPSQHEGHREGWMTKRQERRALRGGRTPLLVLDLSQQVAIDSPPSAGFLSQYDSAIIRPPRVAC